MSAFGSLAAFVAVGAALCACGCTTVGEAARTAPLPIEKLDTEGGRLRFDGAYYDWVDGNGKRGLKLWVPPEVEFMRGVLFHGNPGGSGDTRSKARDIRLQEFAARHDFGIMGVAWFPGREVYASTGKIILRVLNEWGGMGLNPELANVPLIARGSSNAGVTAYAMTCLAPERMICFTPNVGPSYAHAKASDAALKVPGLMHIGPTDRFFTNGVEETRAMFEEVMPRGALWAWDAEQGKGHAIGHIDDVDMKFYETCIALRLPADADPRRGPVKLKPLRREDGWLVDLSSWKSGITHIAPFAEYKGDPKAAGWLPTADIAYLYRSIATYDSPLKLEIVGLKAVENPDSMGRFLSSVGGNVLDEDRAVRLRCDVGTFKDWEEIEFFDGARSLGKVKRGQEPTVAFKVDPKRTVHALCVVARDADGNLRTGQPSYFLVRDPAVSAQLAAQRESLRSGLKRKGKRPSYGSAGVADKLVAAASKYPVLTAWALTAEQEKQFARNGKATPFWAGIEVLEAGAANMSVKAAHARAGLYLLFELQDNSWTSKPNVTMPDGLDFHLARKGASEIWGTPFSPDTFVQAQMYSLLRDERQIQIPVLAAFDPETVIGWNITDPWDLTREEHTLAVAERDYGVVVDFIETAPDRRSVELFLPWRLVGHHAGDAEPAVGTRLGVALGYNDVDAKASPQKVRWPHGLDPWAFKATAEGSKRAWADLLIGPAIP
jgi:hypothetical protein